jgi:hypothetical protein
VLEIVSKLMQLRSESVDEGWGDYILTEVSKLTKVKNILNDFSLRKLNLLVKVLTRYLQLSKDAHSTIFFRKIISLLPLIKDI